ncbi:uncharacterized protein BJX67DRAFT_378197 [Aspergillus lucknowensis]|uniref:Uncharacterized protein n=1 Tax=Aspergillus lucknowensis TaxID=176173 RepID=A0ABR4M0G2_9EURO
MLASEPFCYLLRDAYPSSSPLAEERRDGLADVFLKAVRSMVNCETWINGQPVLRGITELDGVFRRESDHATLHQYCWRPRMDRYEGHKILVVVPEIFEAEVIPAFKPAEEDNGKAAPETDTKAEEDEDVDDGDEEEKADDEEAEWVEGKSE